MDVTCSICIVNYNTELLLRECLTSLIAATQWISCEIFVVDNASSDNSVAMVQKEFPQVTCIAMPWNSGFARANNSAFEQSTGEFFILLNPNAKLNADAIRNALTFMNVTALAGVCGGAICDAEGHVAPSARCFPSLFATFCRMWGLSECFSGSTWFGNHDYRHMDLSHPIRVDWVPSTFAVLRRAALEGESLFDERFFMYYEETDLCLRLHQRHWEVWFVPTVHIMHWGGASARTVQKDFDGTSAQISRWRMRSKYLYLYKHYGIFYVFGSLSIELSRHLVRVLVNALRKGDDAKEKRLDSQRKIQLCLDALRDTRWGRISPPAPWT